MIDTLIQKAYEEARKNQGFAFATVVESTAGTPRKIGAKMMVFADGDIAGTIGGGSSEKKAIEECLRAIKSRKPRLVTYEHFGKKGQPICGGKFNVFIEPFTRVRKLIICGAGHIALPLSIHAKLLNFHVSVIDNRKAFANKKRFPHVDKIMAGDHAQNLKKLCIDKDTFIVVVTHGHQYDYACLRSVIKSASAYIGVIASNTKREQFLKKLRQLKIPNHSLSRVKIPVGLDIGAQTPEEIAVSICSEIISVYNHEFVHSAKFISKKRGAKKAGFLIR